MGGTVAAFYGLIGYMAYRMHQVGMPIPRLADRHHHRTGMWHNYNAGRMD